MKKLVFAIAIGAGILFLGCWLVLSLPTKLKYDKARRELAMAYAVTPMDQTTTRFLFEVESNWICKSDITNGPDADVVKLAGMTPSVSNLIYVWNYQMPAYSWFSPAQNRKSASIGLLKAKFFPISLDKKWHVSADQHLALLWCKTNIVYIYRDERTGLRSTLYVKKTDDGNNTAR